VVALVLALGGLVLLLSGSLGLGDDGLAGALLALANGASFAALTVVNRVPVEGLDPVPMTAIVFSIGGVLLIPIAAIPGLGIATDATGWGLTLVLGIVITACAYVAFLSGLRTVPPFVATIVTLLEPVIAAVLGAIILGERLGPSGIVGGAVLGAAVVLLRPQRDESEPIH
jgi:DME family drug/metabolite transporter